MKKVAFLFVLLLMLGIVSIVLNVNITYAIHEAKVEVTPVFYDGGGELKTFNVTNLPSSIHGIIEVVVTFPTIHAGDKEYKPIDYEFPPGWKATYEPALRQITFLSLEPEKNNIAPGNSGIFKINFTEGPLEEGEYEWTVSTTDSNKDAHTYYPVQIIDRTAPFIRIDYPEDGATVTATWDPYPNRHYLWINVTSMDEISGIGKVEVQVSNETWASDWVDITANKIEDTYYIKWYDLNPGWYNVTARAFDKAGNKATDRNEFEYRVIGVWIKIDPDEGTVWRETWIDKEGVYKSTMYTYGEKTLGTEVTVTGGGFTKNSKVNVTVVHPLWGEILVVKNVETDEKGDFTASFVFPTAPQGVYEVSAIDLEGKRPLYPAQFTVLPEIIFKPVVVIGPAPIEVIATGLPANKYVTSLTCNGTDALLGVNLQVLISRYGMYSWYTDENGTLKTIWADKPGLLMPVLEPGTYEIGLNIITYEEETTTISNYLYVVNDFKDLTSKLDDLELKLDDIKPIIERIDENVIEIKTDVGTIKTDVKNIIENITIIKGGVVEINTTVGTILGYVDDINWDDVITIKTDVGTISGKVESIVWDDVITIKTDVGDIKANVDDIIANLVKPEDVTLGINLAAVLSAIAAIAAIVAAAVVVKRLKVAA